RSIGKFNRQLLPKLLAQSSLYVGYGRLFLLFNQKGPHHGNDARFFGRRVKDDAHLLLASAGAALAVYVDRDEVDPWLIRREMKFRVGNGDFGRWAGWIERLDFRQNLCRRHS